MNDKTLLKDLMNWLSNIAIYSEQLDRRLLKENCEKYADRIAKELYKEETHEFIKKHQG